MSKSHHLLELVNIVLSTSEDADNVKSKYLELDPPNRF